MPFQRDFPPDEGPFDPAIFRGNYNNLDDRTRGLVANLTGKAGKMIAVSAEEDGHEYVDPPGTGTVEYTDIAVPSEGVDDEVAIYTLTAADSRMPKTAESADIPRRRLLVRHPEGAADDCLIQLDDDATLAQGMDWELVVEDDVTGTITIAPRPGSSAALEDATENVVVAPPLGDGIRRKVIITLDRVSGGVWSHAAAGDVVPAGGEYVLDYPLALPGPPTDAAHAATKAYVDSIAGGPPVNEGFSGNKTLASGDAGKWLQYTGSGGHTLTLPGSMDDGFRVTVRHSGSGTLTVAGGESETMAAGTTMALRRAHGKWLAAREIVEDDLT